MSIQNLTVAKLSKINVTTKVCMPPNDNFCVNAGFFGICIQHGVPRMLLFIGYVLQERGQCPSAPRRWYVSADCFTQSHECSWYK